MRLTVWWRRAAVVLTSLAVLGGLGVVTAGPAAAGFDDCSIIHGTPGTPTSFHAFNDGDPRFVIVDWSPPLNNILGRDCRPILEYALWWRDLTSGSDWGLVTTTLTTEVGMGPLDSGHTEQYAVHARNQAGWSVNYAFTTYTVP